MGVQHWKQQAHENLSTSHIDACLVGFSTFANLLAMLARQQSSCTFLAKGIPIFFIYTGYQYLVHGVLLSRARYSLIPFQLLFHVCLAIRA